MKRTLILAAVAALLAAPAFAGERGTVSGEYVEARTAEVFAGGCIMNSEADTMGKQAILAWRVERGAFAGVGIDGLTVVAAVAGDRNLGMHEMGGDKPTVLKAVLLVDERASDAQRDALVAFAREMWKGIPWTTVDVRREAIRFASTARRVEVKAGQAELAVEKKIEHNASCGAMKWFHPLATVDDAAVGTTEANVYSGAALGARWSDPNKRSAFFGTFSY